MPVANEKQSSRKKLRIGVNAQIPTRSGAGGIENVLRVLTLIGRLEGDEEYVFIGHHSDSDWLKPYLSERQTLIPYPQPENVRSASLEKLKTFISPILPLARIVKNRILPPPLKSPAPVPDSNGFYESLNCDVIHFPYQDYVNCRVPTVYNPHDLQHLHFPEFFSPAEIERRAILYPAACRAAKTVVAASQFVKNDLIEKYEIKAEKVQVIPWSPVPLDSVDYVEIDAETLFKKYDCPPPPFILYPAMTWEHKNHIRLLEAVALLRDKENLKINVICTGHKNSFYSRIEKRLLELRLESQVKFTGIVEYEELSFLYRQAQFVIIPTLFEAASGPLYESWQRGVAAACSAITSLPEQAGGAALLFDPFSVEAIAEAIRRMSSNANLRAELVLLGFKRLKNFDMEQTAKRYRAVYRKTAGADLSEEDRDLLNYSADVF